MEILDSEQLLENVDGDRELLAEIVSLFFDSSAGLLRSLREAVVRADAEAIHRDAHQLKGAVANVGGRAAARAAADLEQLGRRGSMAGLEDAYAAVERELGRLEPELRRLTTP